MSPQRSTPATFLAALALTPILGLAGGCDFFDQLTQRTGVVDVFATSHGSPDGEGNLPNRTGSQVVFVNDMGWEVFIDTAIVTTEGVTLHGCDGATYDVEFYWGALAEDIGSTPDFDVTGLGGVRADSGNYCELEVEYGPSAEGMETPAANGSTIYLAGSAVRGEQHVEFEWRSEIALTVDVDISTIEAGGPFHIRTDESFSKKLTVDKSYTSFFEGVDFDADLGQADIDDLLADTLRGRTRAYLGTDSPPSP